MWDTCHCQQTLSCPPLQPPASTHLWSLGSAAHSIYLSGLPLCSAIRGRPTVLQRGLQVGRQVLFWDSILEFPSLLCHEAIFLKQFCQ